MHGGTVCALCGKFGFVTCMILHEGFIMMLILSYEDRVQHILATQHPRQTLD